MVYPTAVGNGRYFLLHFSHTLPAFSASTQQGCAHFSPFLAALSQQPPSLYFESAPKDRVDSKAAAESTVSRVFIVLAGWM